MSKRSPSKPRSRLANPCVVEYLGPNFTEQGTITDLSGAGMKIIGTRSVHVGMRLGLRLSVGNLPHPFRFPAPMCDGRAIKSSGLSLVRWRHQCWHDSTTFYWCTKAHQSIRPRENIVARSSSEWPGLAFPSSFPISRQSKCGGPANRHKQYGLWDVLLRSRYLF